MATLDTCILDAALPTIQGKIGGGFKGARQRTGFQFRRDGMIGKTDNKSRPESGWRHDMGSIPDLIMVITLMIGLICVCCSVLIYFNFPTALR